MSLKIISVKKQASITSEIKDNPRQENPTEAEAVQSQPQNESIAELDANEISEKASPILFQAIGLIEADSVKLLENKIIITIANQEYQGFVRPRYYKQLCEFLEKHDGITYLRVYPKTFTANKKLIFQGWHILDWKKDITPHKTNEFVIKGVWQYISQSENPVITVYRNQESQDPTGKYLPTHLPIKMSRTDYQAFQFDPNATEQARRYFFQGLFEFDAGNNCFVWREDLAPPSDRLPPYRKPTRNPVTAPGVVQK